MTPDNTDHHDLIAQVVNTFDRMPIPPNPSTQETLEMLQANKSRRVGAQTGRTFTKRLVRILALPTTAVAVGIVLLVTFWSSGEGDLAFAQVTEQMSKIDAVSFKFTITSRLRKPDSSGQVYALSPNLLRIDSRGGETTSITITDSAENTVTLLDPTLRQAKVTKVPKSDIDIDIVKRIRDIDDKNARRVEPEGEDDPNTEVFAISEPGTVGKMWVDKTTKLPIRYEIENTCKGSDEGGIAVFSDFDWNPTIDPAMFEIPEGYTRVEGPHYSELQTVP